MSGRFTVAIVGLGLMGGSLAYALRGFRDGAIIGYDIRPETSAQALAAGAVDAVADSPEQAVRQADICLFCADPAGILAGMEACAGSFKSGCVVSEICGVKEEMAQKIPALLPEGVHYIGLHPMAGKEVGGFANAEARIFRGAGFLLIPPENHNRQALELMREVSLYAGAGRVVCNSPHEHDAMIAYTSDLPHAAAAALVARYPAALTPAHTAGAFRDCTRIANIDADLWTELFLGNRAHLIPVLETYIHTLQDLRDALEGEDRRALHDFLETAGGNKRRIQSL